MATPTSEGSGLLVVVVGMGAREGYGAMGKIVA